MTAPTLSPLLEPDAVGRVFVEDTDGGLRFGYSAKSVGATSLAVLYESRVEFQDYVMEGFVKYRLGLRKDGNQTRLDVEFLGSNRDQYLEAHIRWQLGAGG